MNTRVQELADDLTGTCQTLADVCKKHGFAEEDLSMAELGQLDEIVFCCECCGWWDEAGEQDVNQNCEDCREDAGKDEDEDA
jgi:hypothetical protein